MKLDNQKRERLFKIAREINPGLGNLLQNQVHLDLVDLALEVKRIDVIEDSLDHYKENLALLFEEAIQNQKG